MATAETTPDLAELARIALFSDGITIYPRDDPNVWTAEADCYERHFTGVGTSPNRAFEALIAGIHADEARQLRPAAVGR